MTVTEFTDTLTDLLDQNKAFFIVGFPLIAAFTLGVTYIKRYFHRVKKVG